MRKIVLLAVMALTLAGCQTAREDRILGGSLIGEKMTGKWSGSQNGDKTLHGKVKLTLSDGRTIEGTFSVHAITWG